MNRQAAYERPANATGGWLLVAMGPGGALAAAALVAARPGPGTARHYWRCR